jgi:hypothetical protein
MGRIEISPGIAFERYLGLVEGMIPAACSWRLTIAPGPTSYYSVIVNSRSLTPIS